MGRSLEIDSSIQLLPQCSSIIATGGFYRLVPKYNAHAGVIALVEIFLIYPSAIRRYKWVLKL